VKRTVWNYLGVDALAVALWHRAVCGVVDHRWWSARGHPEERTCLRCTRRQLQVNGLWYTQ
jgi:hypothetical protein